MELLGTDCAFILLESAPGEMENDIDIAARLDQHISLESSGAAGARTYRVALREHDEAVLVEYAQQMDGCLAAADSAEFEGAQPVVGQLDSPVTATGRFRHWLGPFVRHGRRRGGPR